MKTSKLILLISILIVLICVSTNVYAGVTVSPSSVSMNVGESKNVSLSASNATGTVSVSSSNSAVATVSADNWIDDGKSINITISGKSAGTATITVSGIVSDNAGKDSDYSETINVTVKAKEQAPTTSSTSGGTSTPSTSTVAEKSSNANVKMIETSPVDFSGFKPNKTSGYEVAVGNDVDKIYVNVNKEDSKASVSLLNKTNSDTGKSWVYIVEGNNEINVTVTAEDGEATKTYTINVTRAEKVEEEEPEKVEEIPEETQEDPMEEVFGLSELKIEGIELEPQFQTDVYEYKIDVEDIEKLKITTLATEANSNIEILGNENFVEGENIVTIHVKSEDEQKNATYQITVNKTVTKIENANEIAQIPEEPSEDLTKYNKNKIVILSVAILAIIIIVIIAIGINTRKNNIFVDERYVTYGDLPNDDEQEEINNNYEDSFEEEPVKKKKSKGKRFK